MAILCFPDYICCCLVADITGNFSDAAPMTLCHAHPMCFLLIVKTTRSVPEGTSIRSSELEDARVYRRGHSPRNNTGLDRNTIGQLKSYSFSIFFSDGDT